MRSKALLIGGAAVLVLVAVLMVLAIADDDETSAEKAVAECREKHDPRDRFAALPAPFAAKTLDAQSEAQLNELMNRQDGDVEVKPEVRDITVAGEPVARGIIMPLGEREARDGFLRGFKNRAAETRAGPPRTVHLGPAGSATEVVLPQAANQVGVVGFSDCLAVLAVGVDSTTARRVARALIVARPSR